MALAENLPVYKVAYDLLLSVFDLCDSMSRVYRFSLGERLLRQTSDLLYHIYWANSVYEKSEPLALARRNAFDVQLMIRVANDKHQITVKQYIAASDRIVSISKQLTAWSKHAADTKN